ncbi:MULTISPECIES: methyl-accepting chemotaxis protein [Phaeobacter]|uniref:methyl-accepting chemotaxis protein n=1 Tax=Phaeobacter TaxID=302485 RepID=UPI00058CDCEF|nr:MULTISPECIES: methyl-accepting chemotaxis protein [Phaeobacter]ATG39800.1 putative methyl-accepting chemotaxis protein [Phaeobacter piscinae]KII18271.1 chemotaxis protein [Phaeobacter sp. S60]
MKFKTSIKTAVFVIVFLASAVMFALIGLSRYTDQLRTEIEAEVAAVEGFAQTLAEVSSDFQNTRLVEMSFRLKPSHDILVTQADTMAHLSNRLETATLQIAELDGMAEAAEYLAQLVAGITAYEAGFAKVVASQERLGFDETNGLQGALRSSVRSIEKALEATVEPEMKIKMLMMRRHEKDFIMRHAEKYIERLNARVDEFRAFPGSYYKNISQRARIGSLLTTYQKSFNAYAEEITLTDSHYKDLDAIEKAAEPVLAAMDELTTARLDMIHASAAEAISTANSNALKAGLGGLGIFVVVAFFLAIGISRPLSRVNVVLQKIMAGDFSTPAPQSRIREVSTIATAVEELRADNEMKDRLTRDISEVIRACAAGDFSKRLQVEGASGSFADLGRGVNAIGEAAEGGLGDIRRVLDTLAAGDLTQRMPDGQKGIFKEIASAVDNLSDNLTGMVQQLSHSSEVLNSTAAEIAAAADDASRRGETSAASLEETAAALQTLDDTVRGTAEGSEQAKDIVRDAFTQARTTSELASQTISAMQRIEDSSGAIAKITDLIEDLAFQTNLLALNAGVEAARAGEAGRGFAVVASEVRGLAQRSADAVQEINQLIDVSTHEVAQGVKLVDQTGTALASIQSSVEAVVGKVEQIAATTVEQSNGLSEVNTAVVSLDQNAQKNSAMLEQTAAAGQMLREEAQTLVQAVSGFTILPTGSVNSGSPAAYDWSGSTFDEMEQPHARSA